MSPRGVLRDLKRCTRTSEPYESDWEREYMLVLDGDPTVKRWERCRSLRIPYERADGAEAHYNPDFMVERTDGSKELHEVKGSHLMEDDETRRKLEVGAAFCRKRGMVFKVITKSL